MILQERIELMVKAGEYLIADNIEWQEVKQRAYEKNGWFTPEFIQHAAIQIAESFLSKDKLEKWVAHYHIDENISPKNIGIIMAGNIPMVGFHDMLAVFITGHYSKIKLSSKDDVLLKHLVKYLSGINPGISDHISFEEMLKGCDAYITTGGSNSARAFKEYFGKYPHIVRSNRTSVAILTGDETADELAAFSDDIHLYFGLGCRNVTKFYVPEGYDFVPLISAFNKYEYFGDHHKYKNNFDYQLSILLLNNVYYMTNNSTLLTENENLFSPISVINYSTYKNPEIVKKLTENNEEVQCIVGKDFIPFGQSQQPDLFTYADGVDTMQFLLGL